MQYLLMFTICIFRQEKTSPVEKQSEIQENKGEEESVRIGQSQPLAYTHTYVDNSWSVLFEISNLYIE